MSTKQWLNIVDLRREINTPPFAHALNICLPLSFASFPLARPAPEGLEDAWDGIPIDEYLAILHRHGIRVPTTQHPRLVTSGDALRSILDLAARRCATDTS